MAADPVRRLRAVVPSDVVAGASGKKARRPKPSPAGLPPGVSSPDWRPFLGDDRSQASVADAEFARVAWILHRRGEDPMDFVTLLTDHCVCWARLAAAESHVAVHGLTQVNQYGVAKNPNATLANQFRNQLRYTLRELKLTPRSAGVVPDTPVEDDPFSV